MTTRHKHPKAHWTKRDQKIRAMFDSMRVSDAEKDTILAEQIAIERERKGARDPAWLNGAQEPYAVPVVKASSLDGCVRVRQYD